MSEEQKRARRGGEIGQNGEFYPGGTYLPSTDLGKRSSHTGRGSSGKVAIAPYVWEVPPQEGLRSIYSRIQAFVCVCDGVMTVRASDYSLNYYGFTRPEIQQLVDRWNAGERWFSSQAE